MDLLVHPGERDWTSQPISGPALALLEQTYRERPWQSLSTATNLNMMRLMLSEHCSASTVDQ